MKTLIIFILLMSLGACKKGGGSNSKNKPPPSPPPLTINEITSVPKTYKSGSQVEFIVMFSQPVEVSGTPHLSLSVGDQTRSAHFDREGEGDSLLFLYEVQENDHDDNGVSLANLAIELNGGSIQDDSDQSLVNTIPKKFRNFPNVKIDGVFPIISNAALADSVDSVVTNGGIVDLVVTFSKPVNVTGVPSLTLDVGGRSAIAVYQNAGSSTMYSLTHTFRYTVGEQQGSIEVTGVTGLDNSNFISDEAGNNVKENTKTSVLISGITVDGLVPRPLSASKKGGVFYVWEDSVDFVVTFNKPVNITGTPDLTLSVGGSSANATYENTGSSTYSTTHIFSYAVAGGQSGSIEVTGVTENNSHFISDELGNKMQENIQPFVSVSGVSIEASDPCVTTVASGFQRGDGSAGSPYLICTYTQLDEIRNDLGAHYELGQDIDASSSWSVGADACTAYDGSTVPTTTPCTGWVPIGNQSARFLGYFEGGGHIISNLYINVSILYSGFFGVIGRQSKVSNIGLTNATVTSTTDNNIYAGKLVGYSYYGDITNSYTTGVLSIQNTNSSESYIGGLVGAAFRGSITNSYATGAVNTPSDNGISHGGGLVGTNDGFIANSYATGAVNISSNNDNSISGGLVGVNGGFITNSYATGESNSTSPSFICFSGGLVGNNANSGVSIRNSYATGNVSCSSTSSYSYAGGLTGFNRNDINHSYATGTVTSTTSTGTAYAGGLVGRNFSPGTTSGTHYFVDNSGTSGIGNGSCSGTCQVKTLAELQGLTSTDVTDWSTNNWNFGTNSQLPRLKYTETAAFCINSTYTTKATCEAASSQWAAEGNECDGDTGVTCGDIISGQ